MDRVTVRKKKSLLHFLIHCSLCTLLDPSETDFCFLLFLSHSENQNFFSCCEKSQSDSSSSSHNSSSNSRKQNKPENLFVSFPFFSYTHRKKKILSPLFIPTRSHLISFHQNSITGKKKKNTNFSFLISPP